LLYHIVDFALSFYSGTAPVGRPQPRTTSALSPMVKVSPTSLVSPSPTSMFSPFNSSQSSVQNSMKRTPEHTILMSKSQKYTVTRPPPRGLRSLDRPSPTEHLPTSCWPVADNGCFLLRSAAAVVPRTHKTLMATRSSLPVYGR